MVNLWIVNTDNDWFDFLSSRPGADEVNFWQPSGRTDFHVLEPGELFVFRLKAPRNAIGGFGVFSHASRLPVSLAWEAFGEKNGAADFAQMRDRVSRYRGELGAPNTDYMIGCRILVQPVFLPEISWIPLPPSWPRNVQVGKAYGTDEAEGRALWDRIVDAGASGLFEAMPRASHVRYGNPALIRPRLGQGAFRIAVTDAYGRQCAVSGGRVLPALEAAHIRAYGEGGEHEVSNGLLLRRDIHSVFDAGYVTIDQDFRFVVSDRVRTDFNNGNEYRRLHGTRLTLPSNPRLAPRREAIDWHNRERFLG
jgi:putative restriction endonuclease